MVVSIGSLRCHSANEFRLLPTEHFVLSVPFSRVRRPRVGRGQGLLRRTRSRLRSPRQAPKEQDDRWLQQTKKPLALRLDFSLELDSCARELKERLAKHDYTLWQCCCLPWGLEELMSHYFATETVFDIWSTLQLGLKNTYIFFTFPLLI